MLRVSSRCLIYKVHAASRRAHLCYHSVFALSSTFFDFFKSLSRSHPQLVCRSNSWSLPHSFRFVKYFFQLFEAVSRAREVPAPQASLYFFNRPLRSELGYNSMPRSVCQHLFSTFFFSDLLAMSWALGTKYAACYYNPKNHIFIMRKLLIDPAASSL